MILNRPARRYREHLIREDVRDERHHAEVGPERAPGRQRIRVLQSRGGNGGNAPRSGGRPEGVRPLAVDGGGCTHAGNCYAILDEALQNGLAERRLAHHGNAHLALRAL